MIVKILNKINTAVTIATTIYAVGKFMYSTFKKYEKKHGNKRREGEDTQQERI